MYTPVINNSYHYIINLNILQLYEHLKHDMYDMTETVVFDLA